MKKLLSFMINSHLWNAKFVMNPSQLILSIIIMRNVKRKETNRRITKLESRQIEGKGDDLQGYFAIFVEESISQKVWQFTSHNVKKSGSKLKSWSQKVKEERCQNPLLISKELLKMEKWQRNNIMNLLLQTIMKRHWSLVKNVDEHFSQILWNDI